MPELSRFFGIVIRMFVEAGEPHHRPHFHAYYQEQTVAVAIDTLEALGGEIPKAQMRLVEAWAEIHRAELESDWALLQSGRSPVKIDPLRQAMAHSIHRVTGFTHVGPYTISVAFADGSRQVIDFRPVLRGELYGPLRDPELFSQVRLDSEVGTLVWPNDADFDPATLHDWPKLAAGMTALAESWSASNDERLDIRMEPTRR